MTPFTSSPFTPPPQLRTAPAWTGTRFALARGAVSASFMAAALACPLLVCITPAVAQEALRSSMAGELAVAARHASVANPPYTWKAGDFRLLVSPSLGLEYNDNVRLREGTQEDDFILRPMLNLRASYPLTAWNLLRLNLGVGYDYYLQNSDLDSFRLSSGSEIAFDMYIKDFWINLHNRFQFTQNSGREAGVAGTGLYGGFDNLAGITTTWDLQDLVLKLGYDHQTFIASSSQFSYLDRATELLLGRAGFRIHPRLTTGIEATGSFTSYDEPVLNDNTGYSAGVYADWQPGAYFRVQPRVGYTAYFFDQTSRFIRAIDQDGWYAALSLTHDITESVSYSIMAGHEIRLGIQADSIESTYVRPSANWRIIKNLTLTTSLSYETGTQGAGRGVGNFQESFDWFSAGIGLGYELIRNLRASLDYRHTLRTADVSARDYTQNVVGLRLSYTFQ